MVLKFYCALYPILDAAKKLQNITKPLPCFVKLAKCSFLWKPYFFSCELDVTCHKTWLLPPLKLCGLSVTILPNSILAFLLFLPTVESPWVILLWAHWWCDQALLYLVFWVQLLRQLCPLLIMIHAQCGAHSDTKQQSVYFFFIE